MKNLPPSMRAIDAGHSLRAGAAETTGAATGALDAMGAAGADSPPLPRVAKKAPVPATTSAAITPAVSPPFDRADAGAAGDATGSRVDGPFDAPANSSVAADPICAA